jgi:hypothetical protein
MSHVEVFDNFE